MVPSATRTRNCGSDLRGPERQASPAVCCAGVRSGRAGACTTQQVLGLRVISNSVVDTHPGAEERIGGL
ncbi:hypothetical protein NDU88_005095 [Pleurodeles waltl]|uniref:Uncharacterized protein n=1 Tax=Pleurodeles waltl TaxID=8319 RepID=A0AAV7MVD0_PLEWA|nr:hypothetical protein NDU88_005095 [Pleurodeles waltl]